MGSEICLSSLRSEVTVLMPSEKVGFNRFKGEEDTLYLVLSMHRGSARPI